MLNSILKLGYEKEEDDSHSRGSPSTLRGGTKVSTAGRNRCLLLLRLFTETDPGGTLTQLMSKESDYFYFRQNSCISGGKGKNGSRRDTIETSWTAQEYSLKGQLCPGWCEKEGGSNGSSTGGPKVFDRPQAVRRANREEERGRGVAAE